LAMFPANIVAAPDCLYFFSRNPSSLADPVTRFLQRIGDDGSGAVIRRARTWIKMPASWQLAATGCYGTGAIVPFYLPVPRANFVAFFRPYRFAHVGFANPLPGFHHRFVVSYGNFPHMLFHHGTIRGPANGNLVFLPHGLAHGIGHFPNVLLQDFL